jgi:hypothetical protein
MSEGADTAFSRPVSQSPKSPAIFSVTRLDPEILILSQALWAGLPSRKETSLRSWLIDWTFLGGMLLLGGLSSLLVLGLSLTFPVYWATTALASESWDEMAFAILLEFGVLTLVVWLVLGMSSMGCWVTFDRRQGLITVSKRPFGWRRQPRVVRSCLLQDVSAVQLVYGGVVEDSLPQSPYDQPSLPIIRQYDWYKFDLVFRDPTIPRLNLAGDSDWTWMPQVGREVAEFLGVPVIDQLYHGPAK